MTADPPRPENTNPFMADDLDGAPATVGHNRPPEPTPIERASELVAAADTWLTTVEAIADAEQAGRAQTFVDQLRANRADLDAARKAERAVRPRG